MCPFLCADGGYRYTNTCKKGRIMLDIEDLSAIMTLTCDADMRA